MSVETVRGREIDTLKRGKRLTAREWQVLTLTAQGLQTKEVALLLGKLSHRTVEIHKERIMEKLGARNGPHAVALAISQGIICLETDIAEEQYQPRRSGRPAKIRSASPEDARKWLKTGGRLS